MLSVSFLHNVKLKRLQSLEMSRPSPISVFLWLTHVDTPMYNLNSLSLHFEWSSWITSVAAGFCFERKFTA